MPDVTPSAPAPAAAARFDPTAPPSYHDVVGPDGPVTAQPQATADSNKKDLPTYDEVLRRQGSQRALFIQAQNGETPTAVSSLLNFSFQFD